MLASGDDDNTGDFYNINGTLIAVADDTTNDQYIITSRSTSTGAILSTLLSYDYDDSSDVGYTFYEGDDALYWTIYDSSTLSFTVIRYPLSGSATEIYSTTLSDSLVGKAVDASGGKVLIAYKYVATRDDSGVATSYTTVGLLYTVSSETSSELSLSDFFENYMQLLIFE